MIWALINIKICHFGSLKPRTYSSELLSWSCNFRDFSWEFFPWSHDSQDFSSEFFLGVLTLRNLFFAYI
jgi:hypothetical protein